MLRSATGFAARKPPPRLMNDIFRRVGAHCKICRSGFTPWRPNHRLDYAQPSRGGQSGQRRGQLERNIMLGTFLLVLLMLLVLGARPMWALRPALAIPASRLPWRPALLSPPALGSLVPPVKAPLVNRGNAVDEGDD